MKPGIPSGTRDFGPKEMVRRNFIFNTIRSVYEKYGFEQIETPAMENLSTLEGKYGEEGDKLLFRILNSGPVFEKIRTEGASLQRKDITEKGLRYDLTVPFARFVAMNRNELAFPFRRYQVQPVWRADRPQKGRYREFYQCDADVIGSDSLLNEIELTLIIVEVFSLLGIEVTIRLNNRKILKGISEVLGLNAEEEMRYFIILDKYDKIGTGIFDELKEEGFSEKTISFTKEIVENLDKIPYGAGRELKIKEMLNGNETGNKGFEELLFIMSALSHSFGTKPDIRHDLSLIRGLNYYTGTIFEVTAKNSGISASILGGGRYDDLTGIFGLPNVSGVGISFGVDRIYDVMNELNLFDKSGLNSTTTCVLFTHFGEAERNFCMQAGTKLRNAGINTEIYPDLTKKISKQFDYANKKGIPYVVIIGEEEMTTGKLSFKNMQTGNQEKLTAEEIIQKLKNS